MRIGKTSLCRRQGALPLRRSVCAPALLLRLLQLSLMALPFSPARAQAPIQPVIKIGVIIPLSGEMALHGVEIRRAMELAQDQRNGARDRAALELKPTSGLRRTCTA